jgi:uncharacterized protein YbjT (DUF2867 family)
MTNKPILIIGKNAKTGRRVEQRLQGMGWHTRAVSRSTHPRFDWQERSSWRSAMEGTVSAYVTYQPDLAIPQALSDIRAFVELARESGLQHIVLLSGRGEEGAQKAEAIIESSGMSWNVLRASWFFQNFSESFLIDGIVNGVLALPAGNTPEPFIDVEDIAEVAVAALSGQLQHNRVYELSGPRAMSFADCMSEISAALQRPVKYRQIPIDDYINGLAEQGFPEQMQWLLRELFTVVLDGRNSQPVNGVKEALGRPATDFATYVNKTVASGVWSVDQARVSAVT